MSWYRNNRWLGNFVIAFAGSALLALWFLFHVRSGFAEAFVQFNDAAAERNRLEHLNPFPNEENYRKTQTALDNYGASLNKLKDELRAQTVPVSPLAPNEFQSRLRRAIVNTTEKARANRVKLPENFHLGAHEAGVPLTKFTQQFKDAFFKDADMLRIKRADEYPAATDQRYIDKMISMIGTLIAK